MGVEVDLERHRAGTLICGQEMQSIGFKEWALVCEALGRGEQTIILRKGGIAEGREGFSFRHREFFLFPTFFHEQIGKVRIAAANIPAPGNTIAIRCFAKVERARGLIRRDRGGPGAVAHLHDRSGAGTFRIQRRRIECRLRGCLEFPGLGFAK